MPDATIPTTTLQQLGGRGFLMMIGCRAPLADGPTLVLRFVAANAHRGPNYCRITLAPSDTYTLEFSRIWGRTVKHVETVEDVYCDALNDVFERVTGLATRLPRIVRGGPRV